MKEFISKLAEFFQDEKGGMSCMRLFNFIIVACAAIEWIHAIFTVGKWSPEWTVIALISGVLGLKVWQKGQEGI